MKQFMVVRTSWQSVVVEAESEEDAVLKSASLPDEMFDDDKEYEDSAYELAGEE
jgi:hypothetical protein